MAGLIDEWLVRNTAKTQINNIFLRSKTKKHSHHRGHRGKPFFVTSYKLQTTNCYSPQRHRGHREKLFTVNFAVGVVNKIKICASMVRMFFSF